MDWTKLDLIATAEAVRTGQVSSRDLVAQAQDRADRYDPALGVFLDRYQQQALDAALAADEAVSAGGELGPLHGVPIGVKDIVATREGPTTAQSPAMDPTWGPGDATVVARLRAAGAIVMGKTSTMEFAYGVPDLSHSFPVPANPWDASTWPGGSSSGSGAGVAAGMFWGAVGTDTGGSVRVPASMCGISGIKPTTGLVPTGGCVPLSYTMDTFGPMARSARDCALMLQVMTDLPTTLGAADLTGLRIGVATMRDVAGDEADPAAFDLLSQAVAVLTELGATVSELRLPRYQEVGATGHITISAERLSWHRPFLADRWQSYGDDARTGMARGAQFSAADYVQAQRVRRRVQLEVAELFDEVDLIVSPMCARTSPSREAIADCMRTWGALVFAMYWNSLGNPAMSVPMGLGSDDLPIGLQLIGRPYEDDLVLSVAQAYQAVTPWHQMTPDLTRIPETAVAVQPTPVDPPPAGITDGAELARHLLERAGITDPAESEVAGVLAGIAPSRLVSERLFAIDCGDDGPAVTLSYP